MSLLEGDNATKAVSAVCTLLKGVLGNNKRKSDLPIDESPGTALKKQVRVNPNFFEKRIEKRGEVTEIQGEDITFKPFSPLSSEFPEYHFSLSRTQLKAADVEIFDVLNIEGTHERQSQTNYLEVHSAEQEIVYVSKETVVKINDDFDENGRKISYIAFKDDNDGKSFFIMKPADSGDLKIKENGRYKVKKVRVNNRQVQQLDDDFNFRITNVLTQGIEEIEKKVSVRFEPANYLQNFYHKMNLTVIIENNSEEAYVKLVNIELFVQSDKELQEMLEIPKNVMNYNIRRNRPFSINLKISPYESGKFGGTLRFNLTNCLDEEFSKNLDISFQILNQFSDFSRLPPTGAGAPRFQDIIIPKRNIPEQLRLAVRLKNDDVAFEAIKEIFPCLKNADLTEDNFKNKLSLEEDFEELFREKSINEFVEKMQNQNRRSKDCSSHLFTFEESDNNDLIKLKGEGIGEARPAIVIGDSIVAMNPCSERPEIFVGRVFAVEVNEIYFKFHENFEPQNQKFDIRFEFNKSMGNAFHHAINIIEDKIGAENLFPVYIKQCQNKKTPIIPAVLQESSLIVDGNTKSWNDGELDQYQKEAVIKALRCEYRPIPMIIHGPPGTGKTKTLVEIIVQLRRLAPNRKIIVSTPSNSAANIFVEKLMKIPELQGSFVRLVSFNQSERHLISPDDIIPFCANVDVSNDVFYDCNLNPTHQEEEKIPKFNKKKITEFSIVITTLCCSVQLMKINFGAFFDTVIVDEAGQATEAETYLPLTQLTRRDGHVILAGDHLQLGPMAFSPFTKRFKLRKSLLERLVNENECYSDKFHGNDMTNATLSKLLNNYRSLPSVLKLYNDLFYGSQLKEIVNDQDSPEHFLLQHLQMHLWKPTTPIVGMLANIPSSFGVYMIDVKNGKNSKNKNSYSYSWFNQKELDSLQTFLAKLHSDDNVKATDIGIITPYVLQRDKIKNSVLQNFSRFESIKVGTVEEFQGQERKIICLSIVRTDPKQFKIPSPDEKLNLDLGFINCEKRLNVSISRSKSLLVIFAKSEALEKHPKWKQVVDYTRNNGRCIVEEN